MDNKESKVVLSYIADENLQELIKVDKYHFSSLVFNVVFLLYKN